MIDEELVKRVIKATGVKRISQILHGRSVLSADALNVKGDADAIAYTAHAAAAAFSMVADNVKASKVMLEFRKTHTFIGYHDEVLCVNMPEPDVVAHLVVLVADAEKKKADVQGEVGLFSRVARGVRKAVSK